MNNVVISGRLANAPEIAYTPSQTACCKFTVAVERRRRKENEQAADFVRVIVWGANAENCNRYLVKGQKVEVKGRITTGSYKDKNTGKTIYTTDVTADDVEFGEKPKQKEPSYDRPNYPEEPGFNGTNDDLPY